MARIAGKLTPRALGWDRNAIGNAVKRVPADGGRVHLGRIVGIVSGLKQTINEENGEIQTGLKGSFRGVSSLNDFKPVMETVTIDGKEVERPKRDAQDQPVMIDTGNAIVVTSGVAYLPGGLQPMIEAALAEAQATDPKASVRFGIDLFGIPAQNKAGYSFDGETLIDATEVDPLAEMLETAASMKALPAPVADVALDPSPEAQREATGAAPAPAETGKATTKAK